MIKKISIKVFITYAVLAGVVLLQGCKEMSSLTSDGIKKATTPGTVVDTPTDTTSVSTNHTIVMNAPSVVEVNQCVPLIISFKNNKNEAVVAVDSINVLVAGAPGTLYSNNTCSIVQSTTVAIAKNALSKTIYVVPTVNQSYVIDLEDVAAKLTGSNFILSVTNPLGTSDSLKLAVSGPGSLQAGQCRSYVVSLQNTLGANKNATSLLALSMSGQGSGSFHAGTNCSGGAISTLNLPMGSSFVSFSYQNSTAENVNFVVDSPVGSSIQSAFYSTQVTALSAAVATQLVLTGPTSVTAGACSGPVVVKTVDASFNSTAVPSILPFTITGGAGFSIFTNASCSTTLASPAISALTSSSSFYFITASPGNIVISADDSGALTDAAISVQATASSGTSAVKFTLSGPASVLAGACSAGYTIKTTNGSGVDSPVSATTVVNITGKGSGDFYDDAGCVTPISSVTFASGDSAKSFYYKGASVANLTFNVDDSGPLTPASTSVAIVPDNPTQLAVTGPSPITLGECRAYTVTAKDVNNFVSSVSGATSINLTGAGAGAFYSDSSCVNSTSSVVINSGQSGALFYYKSLSAASATLSADNSGALIAGTRSIVVDPLPYSKVVFTRPAITAGVCTAVTVTLKDSLNNTSNATSSVGVTLTATGGAAFYSANTCLGGALITSTSIATSSSSVTVYVKDNIAESVTLGASATGLSSDSWNLAVAAAAPATLKLVGPATNSVGSCTAYDLRLEDTLGNLSPAGSSTSVNFSGLSNARFYSDVNCTSLASSTTLLGGTSQAQIYLKGNTAESLTIASTSGSLVAASTPVSLIAGSSNKLIITGAATASAGACTALTVAVQDSFNNPINQGSNLVVTMLGNAPGSFYSEATCTSAASTVTVTSGTSSAIIYYRSNAPASLSFTAQAGGLFDGTKGLNINPLAPSKLVMTGSAAITTGVCTAYSISLQDTLNNLSSAGSAKTLNFSGAGSGAFYSDSSCALPAASISLTSSQTTAAIYYKASVAQTPNLVVDDAGLPDLASSTLPVTVTSSGGGATIALKISGATSANTNTCVPYAVMTTDAGGLSYNVTSNLTATLGGAGTGGFYSDSGCSSTSSTVTITSGTSLAYIYYMAASSQNLVFSATATSASATTLPVAITSGAGPSVVSKLILAGNSSIVINSCIPYIISAADSNNNSMNAASTITISLLGKEAGDFYTDNVCTVSAAGATSIASGSSYTTVYYKNPTPQNLIFVAQSAGLSNGILPVNVSPIEGASTAGPAVKLAFIAQPSSLASTSENFAQQPIVAIQDSNNNVASSSSATITLAAFTDSNCSMSAGAIIQAGTNPMNAAGGVANFTAVNITSSQTVYIKATSPGLASACSSAVQVYPSVAAKLSFTTQPSTTAVAGVNLAVMPQVSVLNHTNQVYTSAVNPITISAFSDNTCTTPVTGTFSIGTNNIIPSSGVSSFTGIKYTLVSTIYLKATASGVTSACSSGISITSAPAHHLEIYTQPQTSGKVGDTFSLTARLYDQYNNIAVVAHNLSITAYKGAECTGAIASITGGSTTSALGTGNFSSIVFVDGGETMSLKITDATSPGVTPACTNLINVDGGTPTKLAFSTAPSLTGSAYFSLKTPPVVMIQDASSNQVRTASNTVTLSAHTDSGCTTPASGVLSATSLALSPSNGLVAFSNVAYAATGTIYLKASSPGLTEVCSSAITITSLAKKIITKSNSTCAIFNGTVKCWGDNASGQLGDNSFANHPYPSTVLNVAGTGELTGIKELSMGGSFTCALSDTGYVYCWGLGTSGQLGDATLISKKLPVQVTGVGGTGVLSNIVSIKSGEYHSCALSSAGLVYCWGLGTSGQLGDNTIVTKSYPVQVSTITSVASISAGNNFSCAVTSTGAAFCWGLNSSNQLGDGTTTQRTTPVAVKGLGNTGTLTGILEISSGDTRSCALTTGGEVVCWGVGTSGQLGDGTSVSKAYPVQVVGVGNSGILGNIISISAGQNHACATDSSKNAYCWGLGTSGQLGDSASATRNYPVRVVGAEKFIDVSAGVSNSCGLVDSGAMYCWGVNTSWALGDQTLTTRATPVRVGDYASVFSSVTAGNTTSCGISGEKVYCWGLGTSGQIGDGTNISKTMPTLVSTLSGAKEVSTGPNHTCVVLKNGEAYCWGENSRGELGNNSTTNSNIPVQVKGPGGVGYLTNVVSISAGGGVSYGHTCAVVASGAAYCWGNNAYGQLGTNNTTSSLAPVQVVGVGAIGYLSNIKTISAGGYSNQGSTCALSNAGAVFCWGFGSTYALGQGTTASSNYPVAVGAGMDSGVTEISARGHAVCAIKAGAGYCWGSNYYSAGGSFYTNGSTPTVRWATGVTSISAGVEFNCAVVDEKVMCHNTYGAYQYHTPAATPILADIQSISASTYNVGSYQKMCALRTGGILYCWGVDGYTTLNFGTAANTSTPGIIALPPSSANQFTSVTAGETHSCGILNGQTQCWGTSAVGAIGIGQTSSLVPAVVLGGQSFVGAGGTHTCSLSSGGEVYCWGENTFGKLGINTTANSQLPVKVLGEGGAGNLSSVTSLGVGYRHNCAISGGSTYCWGYNSQGQLGIDSTMTMGTPTKVVGVDGVGYLATATKVVSGRAHSCALVGTNVYCWGSNQYGQLGANSGAAQSNTPLRVVGVSGVGALSGVTNLTAGGNHTCALASGITYCWGANSSGQLGNDSTQDASYPVGVISSDYITLTGITSVSGGAKHTCAMSTLGESYCWGLGSSGQLGLNSNNDIGVATKVPGVDNIGYLGIYGIATGPAANHTCAISTDQANAYCWGSGTSGQIGDGNSSPIKSSPTPVNYSSIQYLIVR